MCVVVNELFKRIRYLSYHHDRFLKFLKNKTCIDTHLSSGGKSIMAKVKTIVTLWHARTLLIWS